MSSPQKQDSGGGSTDKFVTVHLFIFGKVQGVFFRSSLKLVAEKFLVKGWARNLDDGSVEALLQANETAVRKVIEWCHEGPKDSRVDTINTESVESIERYRNFAVLT